MARKMKSVTFSVVVVVLFVVFNLLRKISPLVEYDESKCKSVMCQKYPARINQNCIYYRIIVVLILIHIHIQSESFNGLN